MIDFEYLTSFHSLLGSEKSVARSLNMRDLQFENNKYYHIYDRGVDKRKIFLSDYDYSRFCDSLFLFNDSNYQHSGVPIDKVVKLTAPDLYASERDPLINMIAYTLIPNHFHFFVEQLQDQGISKFLHKVKKAYSWVFNKRNDRSGALFEGNFKATQIKSEAHFKHMIPYTHLNVLDLTDHDWKSGSVENWSAALRFMDEYKWSSHGIYCDKEQEYPIVDQEVVSRFYSSKEDYLEHVCAWSTREMKDLLSQLATQ